jgi:protein ImuB
MRVACLYLFGNPQSVHPLAEACFRFTPQVAIRSVEEDSTEQAIFLEIGASHRLFSEQSLQLKLISLAKRFGYLSRVTFGETAGEAFALARNPSFLFGGDLPLEALMDFASPFSPAHLMKPDLISSLKTLGLKNVNEFVGLPPCTLASRFGKEAVKLSACVRGEWECAWPGFHPSSAVVEKSRVENSESLEALVFVLKILVDRMMARLCGRSERVSALQIVFNLERSANRKFNLVLPIAQGSVNGVLPILQDYLGAVIQRDPLHAPVEEIQIAAVETVSARGAQKDFFTRKEEEAEIWDALVARLSQKLGKNRVYAASPENRYLPEQSFSKSLKREAKKKEFPMRPSRLLPTPKALKREGAFVTDPASGKSWKIAEAEGPERLFGEWWDSLSFNRDYYRLKTVNGEELWVFLQKNAPEESRAEKTFYLHGYFD